MQGAPVWLLVKELDPAANKSLHAATKDPTWQNEDPVQPNK